MLKLYRRIDGILHYHEAWDDGESVTEHWGRVGERGQTLVHDDIPESEDDPLARVLAKPLAEGFEPLHDEDYVVLLIEFLVDGFGTEQDLAKRHALEDRMNETLGWRGLGLCDGGSIGSGTMEVCCIVVDFDIAARVIAEDLQRTEFGDYARIVRE